MLIRVHRYQPPLPPPSLKQCGTTGMAHKQNMRGCSTVVCCPNRNGNLQGNPRGPAACPGDRPVHWWAAEPVAHPHLGPPLDNGRSIGCVRCISCPLFRERNRRKRKQTQRHSSTEGCGCLPGVTAVTSMESNRNHTRVTPCGKFSRMISRQSGPEIQSESRVFDRRFFFKRWIPPFCFFESAAFLGEGCRVQANTTANISEQGPIATAMHPK